MTNQHKKIDRSIIGCHCCGLIIANDTVMNAYRVLKKIYPEMECSSWTRCQSHNDNVSKAKHSAHLDGLAIDLTYEGGHMLAELIYMGRMLGLKRAFIYKKHVHLDCKYDIPFIKVMEY